ncbi:cell division cycle 20.2, cofactor of APC complex-like [Cryptomeria japonica]|uniref:cell division cycle 20.2, cofactor of APC complex-like n=1 Tax=Cryptomeria japonica TaxID=3369 RepID=UPI0027D9DF21|nr:cell division cycle 20.2, cofactor of APC complex-like [Cryptomeria japonica]
MKKAFGSPQTPRISTLSRRPKITRPLRKQLATPIQNGDRFIANRSSIDFDWARYLVNKSNIIGKKPSKKEYDREPAASLVMDSSKMSRTLSFSRKPSGQGLQSIYSETPSVDTIVRTSRSQSRNIPQVRVIPHAERTLDAPDLVDDNHLNLLDWSDSNILSIALGNAVYLWDANTSTTSELLTVDNDVGPVSSVNWAPDGKHIAIGLTSSSVQIWDSTCNRQLRSLKGHHGRVGSLSWNDTILATGGRDSSIIIHDVRIRNSNVKTYRGHEQEVCGLKWSLSGQQLASGGSDNLLHIWDKSMSSSNVRNQYLHRIDEHFDAVTALAWCPFQHNLLASGGGLADQSIKLWNSLTGACLNTIATNSSVCALLWNRHERELLSSHGYSENQLTLWKYPSMAKTAELTGHTSRVLHLAQSPDGYTVASAGADETLRFWQVFGIPDTSESTKTKEPEGTLNSYLMHIR